jgi:hypothetical protein
MLKTSTMKPFEKGDIFLGCTYLDNPADDHMGDGRILQFDKNWVPKGTLYTEGTRYLIVGCKFAPDGTLWAFDCHDHIAVRVSPDGSQMPNWDSGRAFGSVNWSEDGSLWFGENFNGKEIWQGTSAKLLDNGTLGDGNIYHYRPDLKLLADHVVENAPEFTGFKGVTHSTMHPSGDYITYTTETARRLMRYDIRHGQQMEDLDGFPDADPYDREDKRWFIAPAYMSDGQLLCTGADGLRVYSPAGELIKSIPLPGYGWAQVCPDVDERYALAANVFSGVAARIDLDQEAVVQSADTGMAVPHRSLAGIAVFQG